MHKYFFSLLLLLIIPFFVYGQNKMDQSSKMETNYRGIINALDKGDVSKLDNYCTSDAVDHDLDPSMTKKTGLAGIKDMFNYYHKLFPDMKTTVHSIAISGDLLYAHITQTGTASEPYMGMPVGHKMTMDGMDLIRFKGDKAVEHWGFTSNTDIMKMMPQDKMKQDGMNKKQ
ncbi:MAG: ester cyclase [Ignavibacteriota bacterium]